MGFLLGILGTTTIISELRQIRKHRNRVQEKLGEKTYLMEKGKKADMGKDQDEGYDEEVYEEGYFSLYLCDKDSYDENN